MSKSWPVRDRVFPQTLSLCWVLTHKCRNQHLTFTEWKNAVLCSRGLLATKRVNFITQNWKTAIRLSATLFSSLHTLLRLTIDLLLISESSLPSIILLQSILVFLFWIYFLCKSTYVFIIKPWLGIFFSFFIVMYLLFQSSFSRKSISCWVYIYS